MIFTVSILLSWSYIFQILFLLWFWVCLAQKRSGEGSGTPLQYSCLGNLMDGGAWWAAIYGITQSWTRLKWLSRREISRRFGRQEWSSKPYTVGKIQHIVVDWLAHLSDMKEPCPHSPSFFFTHLRALGQVCECNLSMNGSNSCRSPM